VVAYNTHAVSIGRQICPFSKAHKNCGTWSEIAETLNQMVVKVGGTQILELQYINSMIRYIYESKAKQYYFSKLIIYIFIMGIITAGVIVDYHKLEEAESLNLISSLTLSSVCTFFLIINWLMYELPLLRFDGCKKYFEIADNIIDMLHLLGIVAIVTLKGIMFKQIISDAADIKMDCAVRLLSVMMIFFTMYKVLYLLRCRENFLELIYLIVQTIKIVSVFMIILFIGIFVFWLLYINCAIDEPGTTERGDPSKLVEDDFAGIPFYELKILLYVISNTVADLNYPEFGRWTEMQE